MSVLPLIARQLCFYSIPFQEPQVCTSGIVFSASKMLDLFLLFSFCFLHSRPVFYISDLFLTFRCFLHSRPVSHILNLFLTFSTCFLTCSTLNVLDLFFSFQRSKPAWSSLRRSRRPPMQSLHWKQPWLRSRRQGRSCKTTTTRWP